MTPGRFLPLLLCLLLLAGLAIGLQRGGAGDSRAKFAQAAGGAAPTLDLPLLTAPDTRFKAAEWAGRPYLLNFFASWCLPCHAEHSGLLRLAKAGVSIIGVAYKDKAPAVQAFLRQDGDPFAVIVTDADGQAALDWGATGVPESWLVDRSGKIVFHQAGPLTDDLIDQEILPLWQKLSR